jgi:hypothetical protein
MPLRNTSVKKFKDEVKQAMPGKAQEDRANFHNNFDNVVKETSGVAVDKKDVKKSDKKTTAKPAAQAVEKKAKEDTKATKKVVDNKKVTKATTPVKATSKKSTPKDNKK